MNLILNVIPLLFSLYFNAPNKAVCLNDQELSLYEMINDYRETKGLQSIPLSASLTKVAKAHAKDLMENYSRNGKCNPHSWSDNGEWNGCCYTDDHAKAACMWNKPMEIAQYDSPGYEIVYWHSLAAESGNALAGWKKSKSHNPVVINQGQWRDVSWKAIGVAVYKQYAVVWFGEMQDEKVKPKTCP